MTSAPRVLRGAALHAPAPDRLEGWPDARLEIDAEGRLAHVGPWTGGTADVHLHSHLWLPGFVDSHVHLPQTRIVGSASGPLLPWLEATTFPAEAAFVDPADDHATARSVAHDFADALGAAGTTCALVWGAPDAAATSAALEELDARGLQGAIGPVLMDHGAPDVLCTDPGIALGELERFASRWHGAGDGRWEAVVLPRFALACTPTMLRGAGAFAATHRLRVSTHLAETRAEIEGAYALHGTDDATALGNAGLLHDGTVLAHCVHLDAPGFATLAEHGCIVAHCPDANAFLGSGGMPLGPFDDGTGPRLTLGSDVGAGRSFRLPRAVQAAHDNALRQRLRWPLGRWLWHATTGGAAALGRPDTGHLTVGAWADLAAHPLPAWIGDDLDRALEHVLLHGDAAPVTSTWVRGREVWSSDAR